MGVIEIIKGVVGVICVVCLFGLMSWGIYICIRDLIEDRKR